MKLLNKWILFILIIMFLVITVFSSDTINDENYKNMPKRTVVIGGINDMKPYSYVDGKGKYTGYNVDIMNSIAEELNLSVLYKKVDVDKAIEMLESGEIDLILGWQYDQEFIKTLRYTKPFIKNDFNIFVKYSNNYIKKIEDLENKNVSVYRWDPAYQRVKDIKNVHLYVCNDQNQAYLMMKRGMADAYVANRSLSMNYVDDPLYKRSIKIVGPKIEVLPSGAAALKSNTELINLINQGIDIIKYSKKADKIYDEWFGGKITENLEFLYQIIYIIVGVGIMLLFLVYAVIRLNTLLKKEVEQRTIVIQEETEFKKEIINSLSLGLVTVDTNMKITSVNKKINELKIIGDKIIEGMHIEDTVLTKISNVEEFQTVIKKNEKSISKQKKFEVNENTIYIEYSITPIIFKEQVRGATFIVKDITEDVNIRNKLLMKDKMKTIGQLTAGIAHEIRNPLTTIDVYISLLNERIDDPEFRNQIVEDLPLEINRINNIVQNLLDYAKPNNPELKQFNLYDEVQSTVRLYKKNITDNNLSINIDIDKNINILFDQYHFRQIVINLLNNAINAVKDNDNPTINITADDKLNFVEFMINDNGKGIKKEFLDEIFHPFYTTSKDGNGLGLAIVSQLIKENDANIKVESELCKGTSFIVQIKKNQINI